LSNVNVLLSRRDVAELMGLNVETIKYHRAAGTMPDPDYIVDQKPLWRRETIERWIAIRRKRV
jgi:predicted DNA-binding transcriptional regulator AlpA